MNHGIHDDTQDSTPLQHFVFRGTSERMARQAWWAGFATCAALVVALAAIAALGFIPL